MILFRVHFICICKSCCTALLIICTATTQKAACCFLKSWIFCIMIYRWTQITCMFRSVAVRCCRLMRWSCATVTGLNLSRRLLRIYAPVCILWICVSWHLKICLLCMLDSALAGGSAFDKSLMRVCLKGKEVWIYEWCCKKYKECCTAKQTDWELMTGTKLEVYMYFQI